MKSLKPWLLALSLSAFLAIIFAWPLLTRINALGTWDWPEASATYKAARNTILYYNQFPLWNPYLCGGAPALANPQTYFLSPTFLFVLLIDTVRGPKFAVLFYIFLGGIGMWLLTQELKIPNPASLISIPIFLTSGFLGTHLAAGQFLWLTIAYVPWIFYGYRRSRTDWWGIPLSAFFLALIGLEGRSYLLAYCVLMLGSIAFMRDILHRNRDWALVRVALIVILAFSFGAWKFVPDLFFISESNHTLEETASIPFLVLPKMFLLRDISFDATYAGDGGVYPAWVEYGYYIGIIPLVLAALALLQPRWRRTLVPFLFGAIILFAVAMSTPRSDILEFIPIVRDLRNPQRAMIMVIFIISLLSGFGLAFLQNLWRKKITGYCFSILVILLVIADLSSVTAPVLAKGFAHISIPQKSSEINWIYRFVQSNEADPYQVVRTNRGAKDFCPAVLTAWYPQQSSLVAPAEDPTTYHGEIYTEGSGQATLTSFTPNKLTIMVDSPRPTVVVINQNTAAGWQTTYGVMDFSKHGLLTIHVPAGKKLFTVFYTPPGLWLGSAITVGSLLIMAVAWYLLRSRFSPPNDITIE